MRHDTRDDYQDPVRGHFIEISTIARRCELGGDYTFDSTTIDTRWFIPVSPGAPAAICLSGPCNRHELTPRFKPWRCLAAATSFAAISWARHRDRKLAVFQSEFRIPLRGRWGAVAYAATGHVFRATGPAKCRRTNSNPPPEPASATRSRTSRKSTSASIQRGDAKHPTQVFTLSLRRSVLIQTACHGVV
jgi:hypothetical protein